MNYHFGRARLQVLIHGNISAFRNFDLQMDWEDGARNDPTIVLAFIW